MQVLAKTTAKRAPAKANNRVRARVGKKQDSTLLVREAVRQVALLRNRLASPSGSPGGYNPADLLDSQALTRSMMKSILNGRGEVVSVWLSNSMGNVASSAGAVVALTYSAFLSNCAGYADWLAVFGTYRIRKATFDYKPYFKGTGTNTGQAAMGIRYGSNVTAPASTLEVQQLEDSQVVPLCDQAHAVADFNSGYTDYIAAAFPSTVYASWLLYTSSTSGVGISTNYGSVSGKILVEFEGLI